jgi:hypothetical protein
MTAISAVAENDFASTATAPMNFGMWRYSTLPDRQNFISRASCPKKDHLKNGQSYELPSEFSLSGMRATLAVIPQSRSRGSD